MKKAIVILAAAMSMVCCNKPEGTETGTAAADSAQISAKAATTKMTDSTGKIPELEKEKSQRKDDLKNLYQKAIQQFHLKPLKMFRSRKTLWQKKQQLRP